MEKKIRRKKRGGKINLKSKWTALSIILLLVAGLSIYFLVFSSSTAVYEAIPYTAAIIDQLAINHPNSTFIQNVNNTLMSAGFTVDYYNYSQITVDFYKQLPSKRYSLIILRGHSGVGRYSGLTCVYTSENYSDWLHYREQIDKQVVAVEYVENGPKYFAITSNFVKVLDICKNSTIIMMGCDGLNKTDMAKAFVEKGVNVYISWDGPVSPEHTDKAIDQLIRNLVSNNQTIGEAIDNISPDPHYNSRLAYYPSEAGDYPITRTAENFYTQILIRMIGSVRPRKNFKFSFASD